MITVFVFTNIVCFHTQFIALTIISSSSSSQFYFYAVHLMEVNHELMNSYHLHGCCIILFMEKMALKHSDSTSEACVGIGLTHLKYLLHENVTALISFIHSSLLESYMIGR
jgi:hypothetical protein